MNSQVNKFIKTSELTWEFTDDIEEIKNDVMYHIMRLKIEENEENFNTKSKEMLNIIFENLEKRKEIFLKLQSDQCLSELFYNKTLKFRISLLTKLSFTFALSNFVGFYLLIYKIYAWDVIEPITYIVGNLYWIATLGYLVFTNRKLDFDLFETKTIKEIYSDKIAKKFGFNKKEKLMIENELEKIEDLKYTLENLNSYDRHNSHIKY